MDPKTALEAIESGDVDPSTIPAAERRPIVAYLLARGHRKFEVAELFGVHAETIRRDCRHIERHGVMEMGGVSVRAMGFGLTTKLMAAWEECMALLRAAKDAGDTAGAVSALREGRETLKDMKRILQDLGLLYREPDKIQVETLARNLFVERLQIIVGAIAEVAPEPERRKVLAEILERDLGIPLDPEHAGGSSDQGGA